MSSHYAQEPQPTGSVIIHTTQGELLVELFAKQTPLTCRNFLQLSLDGYYDDTIFHRLVPGFILQGGDPSGTGHGGESIYDGGALSGDLDPWPMDQRKGKNAGPMGVNFKDEFHSRLHFNRRGLLGMANEGTPDTNGSQFFFTLGKTEELNKKNTLFGRVAGDTIYNLAKMGEAEVEEGTERPLYPMKITHIEILTNPFEGMQKREKKTNVQAQRPTGADKKQKKRKGGKQLLSFGDEEGDEDLPILKKPKFDTRIVMDVDEEPEQPVSQPKGSKKKAQKLPEKEPDREVSPKKASPSPSRSPPRPPKSGKEAQKQEKYREESSPEPEPPAKQSLLERTNAEIAAVKASMKRTIHTEPVKEKKKSVLEQLIPESAVRARKRRPGGANVNGKEEQAALALFNSFKSKLEQVASTGKKADAAPITQDEEKGKDKAEEDGDGEVCDLHFIANCQSCRAWDQVDEKEDSDDEGWMTHTLSFAADKLGKDLSYRKKAEEELVVIDPLEKARTLQEEKRAAREARMGGSSRAWDKGRK
ncbi:Cyclophilin-like domain containing protein [Naviculisporaceae sp. PSN 640]